MKTKPTTAAPWLWPDRTIGKRESRELREEQNRLVNRLAELEEVLTAARRAVKYSKLAEADINDQQTGWFYQWSAATEKLERLTRPSE